MSRAGIVMIMIGGALLLWALSVALVYWDARRRRLSDVRRTLWLAAAALLPGAGFLAYLFIRILNEFLKPADEGRGLKWVTQVKRSRGPAVKGSTIPATDLLQSPYRPQQQGAPVLRQPPNYSGAQDASGRPAGPGMAAGGALWVMVNDGPERGKTYPLQGLPAVIGRGPDVIVSLDGDLGVSRHHAEIYTQGNVLRIRDLRSTHGTYVNGQIITDKRLEAGDQDAIGQSILQVQSAGRQGR